MVRGSMLWRSLWALDLTPPVRLAERDPHRVRLPVGVHDDPALTFRRPPDGLDERPLPQEALLVRVQDGDERNLRWVETLPGG